MIKQEIIVPKEYFSNRKWHKWDFAINCANRAVKGTFPQNVGKMTDIFPKYVELADKNGKEISIEEFKKFYFDNYDGKNKIHQATLKIQNYLKNRDSQWKDLPIENIENWVADLCLAKTFFGLSAQYLIVRDIAKSLNTSDFRDANAQEESKNIDGYINGVGIQIKPATRKSVDRLGLTIGEDMPVEVVYYDKDKKTGTITYEYNPEVFEIK